MFHQSGGRVKVMAAGEPENEIDRWRVHDRSPLIRHGRYAGLHSLEGVEVEVWQAARLWQETTRLFRELSCADFSGGNALNSHLTEVVHRWSTCGLANG